MNHSLIGGRWRRWPGRLRLRIESSAEDRRQFYEAILPAAEQALEYLGQFSLDELPPEASRLLQLMLSLAEISLTQEVYTPEVEAVHARSNRLIRVLRRSSTAAEYLLDRPWLSLHVGENGTLNP